MRKGAIQILKGPGLLREVNEKRILTYLRANKTGSRQEMADEFGVSKNTVSVIVEKFIQDGVIQEIGIDVAGIGRPRKTLSLISGAYHSVGVQIRDTGFEMVVVDYSGEIVKSLEVNTDAHNASACLREVEESFRKLEKQYQNIVGIGIAVPGLVDPTTGTVHYSSHLNWRNVNVPEFLRSAISVPISVMNRVKAAALSPKGIIPEGASSTFYIRIDEGVGGAYLIGKEVIHGANRTAGEIGHIVVEQDGPLCSCGQKGCLETLVSIPNVLKAIRRNNVQLDNTDSMDTVSLSELLLMNSAHIGDIMSLAGTRLGHALSTVVNLLNPEFLIIDSPYNGIREFETSTVASLSRRALPYPMERTRAIFVHTSLSSSLGMAMAMIIQSETIQLPST